VHLKDPGLDVRIILKFILIGCEGVDWIHVAEGRDHWQTLGNTVTYLLVP
jgi:hypothetical protein